MLQKLNFINIENKIKIIGFIHTNLNPLFIAIKFKYKKSLSKSQFIMIIT